MEASGRGSAIGGGDGDDYLVALRGASVHGGRDNDDIGAELSRRKRIEVDGGAGRDAVRLEAPKSDFRRGLAYVVDVPRGRVTAGGTTRARYEGAELLSFSAPGGSLRYVGGSGRDSVSGSGGLRITAYGRGGRDFLVGGKRNDLLVGGPGRDQTRRRCRS